MVIQRSRGAGRRSRRPTAPAKDGERGLVCCARNEAAGLRGKKSATAVAGTGGAGTARTPSTRSSQRGGMGRFDLAGDGRGDRPSSNAARQAPARSPAPRLAGPPWSRPTTRRPFGPCRTAPVRLDIARSRLAPAPKVARPEVASVQWPQLDLDQSEVERPPQPTPFYVRLAEDKLRQHTGARSTRMPRAAAI